MLCLLTGHTYELVPGAGQFKGQTYLVCKDCGRTEPVSANEVRADASVGREFSGLRGNVADAPGAATSKP